MSETITVTAEQYLSFMPRRCAVPPAFWDRVKSRAEADGLSGEMEQEYSKTNEHVMSERTANLWWGASDEMDLERAMFRRWVLRLFGKPAIWPWERGWTQEALASYLDGPETCSLGSVHKGVQP